MQSGAPFCTDARMKHAFQTEHIDYSSMFNSSSSLDPIVWNLSTDFSDSTIPTPNPNSNDIPSTYATLHPMAINHNNHYGSNNTSPVSIRNIFDSSLLTTVAVPDHVDSTSSKPPSPPTSNNTNSKPTPEEDAMVRRIHRKVGGPSKLSTYDEPARVRRVVIEALANEQKSDFDAGRIGRGQLSASERRVVRTVTNRGAAVRSRMRQRREMAALRMQVRARDGRVKQLEAVVRALCSAYAVPLPPSVIPNIQEDQDSLNINTSPITKVIDETMSQQQQIPQLQQGEINGTPTESFFGSLGEISVREQGQLGHFKIS